MYLSATTRIIVGGESGGGCESKEAGSWRLTGDLGAARGVETADEVGNHPSCTCAGEWRYRAPVLP